MNEGGGSAIIFGGASGLGAAAARHLSGTGSRVVVADVDEKSARTLADDIDGIAVKCDVTDAQSVQGAVDVAAAQNGGLRIAVICAGIGPPAKIIGRDGVAPLVRFTETININLIGTINALRLSAGAMSVNTPDASGERGVVVATASIAAYEGQIGQVAYAASKGGIVSLTLPAARELASWGIRVATIAPGLFDTPLLAGLPAAARDSLGEKVPFPSRLGDPAEYAELVGHIVHNSMINGEVIRLDGALRMAPR